jgi:hypothetical protein
MGVVDYIMLVVMGLCTLGLIGSMWGMYCNNQTFNHRGIMISKIAKDYNYNFTDFNKVKYDTHMWYLFFFRDATKLYPDYLNWKK